MFSAFSKIVVCCCLLFSISNSLLSKKNFLTTQNLTDSLVKILNYPTSDSTRSFELIKISYLLKNTNPLLIFEGLKKTKTFIELVDFSKEISTIYANNGNYNRAVMYSQIGLLYTDSAPTPFLKKELLYNLYTYYTATSNPTLALANYQNYVEINDSINRTFFLDSISKINFKNKSDKLSESILYKKDIETLEQKNKVQNNFLTYLYGIVVALLLIILFFVYNKYKLNRRLEQETTENKILINDEKQKIIYFEKKLKESDKVFEEFKLKTEQEQIDRAKEIIKISRIEKPENANFYNLNENLLRKVGVTDMTDLIKFSGGDKLIICNFLKIFLIRLPDLINQIETDLNQGNLEGIRITTNSMKYMLFQILSSKYKSMVVNVTRSVDTEDKLRPTMIADFVKICQMAVGEVSEIVN